MSCLTLEKARELINSFDEPLIIAMHRRGDNINGYFKDVLKYIKYNKGKKYNIVELDVSNIPEFCAEYRIVTPCTALFLNRNKEWTFGEFATISYIETMTSMLCNSDVTRIHTDEEEDDEIDF